MLEENLEENLKTIKDSELDIELLQRKNELLCTDNNLEIAKLKEKIILTESKLEKEFMKSGEEKTECKFGNYRGILGLYKQPDEWIYDVETIPDIHAIYPDDSKRYIKTTTTETLIKATIKEDILSGKIGLPSVTVVPQKPKFKYSIKKKK